jgi:cell division transport system permease protein
MSMLAPKPQRRILDEGRQTRVMLWIMAIMLFLTALAAGLGLGTERAARLLDRQLAGRLTVQIVVADPVRRDAEASAALTALRQSPDVARAEPVDRTELERLLRPWLGSDSADPDLPIPAMIDVDLKNADPAASSQLASAVQAAASDARIDRHETWMSPIAHVMRLVVGFAFGLVVLMALATATVVVLAARAGLDAHRTTIDVLHMLGSTDIQIARLFQRRIAFDTLAGGVIGAIAAAAVLVFAGVEIAGLGSDLVAGVSLDIGDWIVIALLPIAFALLATFAARVSVLRALKAIL